MTPDGDTPRPPSPSTILHLVPAPSWAVDPDRPYAPASLAEEGFVHCSPDVATTLAVATAFYAGAPRPLLVLHLDVARLRAEVVLEAPSPAPPPGVRDDVLFPHVRGPLDRDAVTSVGEVEWDGPTAVRIRARGPMLPPGTTVRGPEGRDE